MIDEKEKRRIRRAGCSIARLERRPTHDLDRYLEGWNDAIAICVALGVDIGLDSSGEYDVVNVITRYYHIYRRKLRTAIEIERCTPGPAITKSKKP